MKKIRIGLFVQLFFFIILPLAGLLLIFSFGSVIVHQNEMRGIVGERDALAMRAAGETIQRAIEARHSALKRLLLEAEPPATNSLAATAIFKSGTPEFNLGVALLDESGKRIAGAGLASELPAAVSFNTTGMTTLPISGGRVAAILVEKTSDGRMTGLGAFDLTSLLTQSIASLLPAKPEIRAFIVDEQGQVLYQSGSSGLSETVAEHPGVKQAVAGQSGTMFISTGSGEHVVTYTNVMGWALVMEEPWQTSLNPLLNTSQVGPLILAPLLVVMLLALWFGVRQIIQPLQALERKASRLATGDFRDVDQPVGGIAEIRHLQHELDSMAIRLQEAQRNLHRYIGAITTAQEDERRRLARELHDDTLQAIIALKQRLQLAQMNVKEKAGNHSLQEVQELAEKTILNLRRMMHALRPIYLDDLGLIPALEMLVREVNQPGLKIDFRYEGPIKRLDATLELALYRMVQEALNNIEKHAQASQAHLLVSFTDTEVTVEVSDNGAGFEVPPVAGAFAAQGHFGLLGLHERADLISAKLEINSQLGQGTRVTIRLSPIQV